jgi:hypothetical protein
VGTDNSFSEPLFSSIAKSNLARRHGNIRI